jgi:hypothetical protein
LYDDLNLWHARLRAACCPSGGNEQKIAEKSFLKNLVPELRTNIILFGSQLLKLLVYDTGLIKASRVPPFDSLYAFGRGVGSIWGWRP